MKQISRYGETEAFESALAAQPEAAHYRLRLFVSGSTPRSAHAIRNIRALCEEMLHGRYELEVIDIYQHPEEIQPEQIIVTPTLVKKLPLPFRKIIGDLSDKDRVLIGLDLVPLEAPGTPRRTKMASETREDLRERNRELQDRLDEAEETLRALRSGEVDAVVASGPDGDHIYTLKGADEGYRVMVETMAEAALTATRDGLILFSNEQFACLLGVPLQVAIGSSLHDWIAADDAAKLAAVLADPASRKVDVQLKTAAALVPVQVSGSTLPVDDAECVCLVLTDLTAQKRAAEEALQQERSHADLIDTMLAGYAHCRMIFEDGAPVDFVYLRVNGAFESLTGLHDVVGKRVSEVIPGILEADSEVLAHYARVVRTGKPEQFEILLKSLGKWLSVSSYCPEENHFIAVFDDITGRKLAEETLRESERRYRALSTSLPILVWSCTAEGLYDYLGPQWVEYTGIPAEEQLGYGWVRQVHPEDLPLAQARWAEAVATGSTFEVEFRIRRSDGVYRWFHTRAGPQRDGEGRLVKWFGFHTDIDGRKNAEEELARSQQMLRLVLDTVPQGVFWKDKGGRYLGCNLRFAADLSVSAPDEVRGRTDDELPWREYAEMYRADDREVIATGAPKLAFEGPRRFADGALRWTLNSKAPLRDGKGEVIGVLGTYQDITPQKRAREALAESEERFRRAVTESPFPILLHAEDGEVLQVSDSWCEITGYSRDDLRTIADWTERAYGERREAVRADIEKLYRLDHRVYEGDYAIRTGSGAVRTWEFSSAPLGRIPDGRRLVISMALDVTERRRAEAAVRSLNDRLELLRVAVQRLAAARDVESIVAVASGAARSIVDADGATFMLRAGDTCHCAGEDSISPLWKGRIFPLDACISG